MKMSYGACVRKFVDSAVVWSRVLPICIALVACSGNDNDYVLADNDPVGAIAALNHDNYIDIAGYVVGIYTGKIYDPAILSGEAFVAGNEPNSVEILDPQLGVSRSIYGCSNGGTATITSFSSAAGAGRTLDQVFETCEWNEHVHSGRVLYQLEPYGRLSWTFTEFVLADSDGHRVQLSGTVRRGYNQCKADSFDAWGAQLDRYEAETDTGTTLLTALSTDSSEDHFRFRFVPRC